MYRSFKWGKKGDEESTPIVYVIFVSILLIMGLLVIMSYLRSVDSAVTFKSDALSHAALVSRLLYSDECFANEELGPSGYYVTPGIIDKSKLPSDKNTIPEKCIDDWDMRYGARKNSDGDKKIDKLRIGMEVTPINDSFEEEDYLLAVPKKAGDIKLGCDSHNKWDRISKHTIMIKDGAALKKGYVLICSKQVGKDETA